MTFLPVKAFCFEKPLNPTILENPWGREDIKQDPRFASHVFQVFDLDEIVNAMSIAY